MKKAFLFAFLLISTPALAEENGWLTSGYLYSYAEKARLLQTSFCGKDRRDLTANLGVDVTIYKYDMLKLHAHTAHHSCIFGPDKVDYNAEGIGLVIKFERHGWFWEK